MSTSPSQPPQNASAAVASPSAENVQNIEGGRFYDENARKVSNMIDEELKQESVKRKEARHKEVKVMLLGQAESGKSTLQKQFQLYYASQTLDHERPSWRPVVYFNILKAVRMILNELDYEFSNQFTDDPDLPEPDIQEVSFHQHRTDQVQSEIADLRAKLLPLISMEDALASELNGGVSISGGRTGAFVRSGWQALVTPNLNWPKSERTASPRALEVALLAARTLGNVSAHVETLWRHHAVKRLVELRKLRLDESAPFFLDHIQRIAEPDYLPTTDDILNVRLQTLGVMEHSFLINMAGSTYNWKLYDVGGARGQRHAWVPYFDDATAIIFLAPISAFDQYLEEDPRTNRIEDSLQLFTAICSNKLLKNAHLADLLKKKIRAGHKVQKYITSYGDRPNNYEAVSEYFRSHFVQLHRRKDISHRVLYVHFTSMLDIKTTQSVIENVGEAIIRQHIAQIGLS
ncbi:G-protein alpha subunit [Infundibulicybe gibba]|nr:G-protein alpha subunit [Infundibulicybe gibba]